MSIRNISDAFRKCLGDRATCLSATMHYERDEDGKESQVLTFGVQPQGRSVTTFTHKIPGSKDPVDGAREAATAYLNRLMAN